jgi:phosphopantothenate-cysteine ligase
MNILITGGGTDERIDNVRSITNMSTGRLACVIAEAFAALDETERVLYVCGKRALRPRSEKAEILPVGDVADLARTVTELCEGGGIDAIIHAMAVSDYTVRAVSTADAIAESAASRLGAAGNLGSGADAADFRRALRDALAAADGFARDGKIPSNAEDLVVFMRRTPKVISMLRALAPRAVIVGFKLLDGVTEEHLIEVAHALLRQNDCDFVLANDLREIGDAGHVGHLTGRDGAYVTYADKDEIARGIVGAVMQELGRGR